MYNSAYFSERYQIIKKIGTGGMSSVYLCVDKNIHKKWAIKQLSEGAITSCELARYKGKSYTNSEIELLKSLDYYMFPRIVDAFIENEKVCIVTDYIDGDNLSSYIKKQGKLPIEIALSYFEELLNALNYLHSLDNPILYLDMKPSNIMIRNDGSIRLIDFGIAGSILYKSKSIGSIGYSPPEQYMEGAKLSEKSDIFALAMTLYEMITAKRPNKDLFTQRDIIKKSKKIPSNIKELLLCCTEPKMEKRPSIDEIIRFLHKKRRSERGIISVMAVTCFVCLIFCFFVNKANSYYKMNTYEKYRQEMITKLSDHIENGKYTSEGIRIICGYIDGNFLDEDTKEIYAYEVAKFYFSCQKDYARAKVYFQKIDKDKYPEVVNYLQVCNRMLCFEEDDNQLIELMKMEIETNAEETKNNG